MPAPTVQPLKVYKPAAEVNKTAPVTANVSTLNTAYVTHLKSQTLMCDVLDSQERVHDKGILYLSKLSDQTDPQYEAYKQRASFPMFTAHSLNTFVGMALRKDLLLHSVPKDFDRNVDGAGTTLTAYIKILLQQFLSYGRGLTLVEYASKGATKKRPKLVFYNYLSLINWKTRVIDGVTQLSMVVLKEYIADPRYANDEFSNATVAQYRVLSLDEGTNYYRQRVYNEDEVLVSNTVPMKNREPLKFIPAVIHGGVDLKKPPLLSIAEQNLAWYRLDADYKHGLHYTALPTPGTTGVDPDDVHAPKSIGPTKIWHLPDGATAFMLEFSGAGLTAVAAAKADISENIITLSSRILSPSTNVNETATAASIRNAGETASLADIVNMLSREMTLIAEMALNWDNIVTDIYIGINTDFIPTVLSGGDAASYGAMTTKGTLSRRSLFEICKQGEIQAGERTFEEEQADIEVDRDAEDKRVIKLAYEVAKAEAKGATDGAPQEVTNTDSGGEDETNNNSEDGKVSSDSDDLQGKGGEQSNNAQNQTEN